MSRSRKSETDSNCIIRSGGGDCCGRRQRCQKFVNPSKRQVLQSKAFKRQHSRPDSLATDLQILKRHWPDFQTHVGGIDDEPQVLSTAEHLQTDRKTRIKKRGSARNPPVPCGTTPRSMLTADHSAAARLWTKGSGIFESSGGRTSLLLGPGQSCVLPGRSTGVEDAGLDGLAHRYAMDLGSVNPDRLIAIRVPAVQRLHAHCLQLRRRNKASLLLLGGPQVAKAVFGTEAARRLRLPSLHQVAQVAMNLLIRTDPNGRTSSLTYGDA